MTPRTEVLFGLAWRVLFIAAVAGLSAPMFLESARVVAHPAPCACECAP